MLGFANSAQQRQNGFVGRGNCFVAAVPTKPSRANTRHFNALGERLKAPAKTLRPRSINLASAQARAKLAAYWMKSPHFCIAPSAAPQGMIGTLDVEFFGEPSISLSE